MLVSGCYILRVSYDHNNLYNSRESIENIINDANTNVFLRKKLGLVADVLNYAKKAGLKTKGAYRYFIDNNREVVSHLLIVSDFDKLKRHMWWYPVVGSLPYRGFFSQSLRDKEASVWEEKGFDTHRFEASGFSSLGWFDDPLYMSMIKRRESLLAELLFHELAHKTLWLSKKVEFNEQLAEFVAEFLVIKYLQEKGKRKEQVFYKKKKRDHKLFKIWLGDLKNHLTAYFAGIKGSSRQEIIAGKKEIYDLYLTKKKPAFKLIDYVGSRTWNNARVMASSLYDYDYERFEKSYKCSGVTKIGKFLKVLEGEIKTIKEPFRALDFLCRKKEAVRI